MNNEAAIAHPIPYEDHLLPTATIGDRANAQHIPYRNSWQFSMWFSKAAVLADFLKPTLKLVDELTARQRDPLSLARYLVERSDQREIALNNGSDQTEADEAEGKMEARCFADTARVANRPHRHRSDRDLEILNFSHCQKDSMNKNQFV